MFLIRSLPSAAPLRDMTSARDTNPVGVFRRVGKIITYTAGIAVIVLPPYSGSERVRRTHALPICRYEKSGV
ncbi:hypothetical protein TNCV_2232571 [Trichonephila clavipes]|nr:hypothetical protein TNCV_2232571 [Trichonephila clavipes]